MDEETEDLPLTGEVMDVDGVAAYLGFSSSTIYSKVRELDIPHVRLGGSLRFPKSEIDKWLSRNTVRPQESFYNYFAKMAGRFFFERWLESRGLSPEAAGEEEVAESARVALKDLRDYKAESEPYVD
ncbi:MAG: helix-turn-helix domain-containing protein [Vulcanimicrobiota bacterium]